MTRVSRSSFNAELGHFTSLIYRCTVCFQLFWDVSVLDWNPAVINTLMISSSFAVLRSLCALLVYTQINRASRGHSTTECVRPVKKQQQSISASSQKLEFLMLFVFIIMVSILGGWGGGWDDTVLRPLLYLECFDWSEMVVNGIPSMHHWLYNKPLGCPT